jgi:ABC-type phosphate transport system substrate-binding protein
VESIVVDSNVDSWTFETSTDKYNGQGEMVFSTKRRSFGEYQRSLITSEVESLMARITELEAQLAAREASDVATDDRVTQLENAAQQSSAREPIPLHGSGTTNPSKCYWQLMDQLMERSRAATRMTYRAVGSSTGGAEFVGDAASSFEAYAHFGSGDIPLSASLYQTLQDNNKVALQIPLVVGAISVFHSVPGLPSEGADGLHLSACLLAKIFKRNITVWSDPLVLADNPNLLNYIEEGLAITVAHRVLGSSSTSSVTAYLNTACPSEWGSELVGSSITWPTDTVGCQGSGGMTDCIRNVAGTIGYLDAGHGHEEKLSEIELLNAAGTFLTSKQASAAGGIAEAANDALINNVIPTDPTADFSAVNLLNRGGQNTWPIVAMTYVYVRQDLTALGESGALTKAFLQYLLSDALEQCRVYGFSIVPEAVLNISKAAVESIVVASEAEAWSFETATDKYNGQGEKVFSSKRRSFGEYQRSLMTSEMESMKTSMESMTTSNTELEAQVQSIEGGSDADTGTPIALAVVAIVLSIVNFAYTFLVATKGKNSPPGLDSDN